MDYNNMVKVTINKKAEVVYISNSFHDDFFNNDFVDIVLCYISGNTIKHCTCSTLAGKDLSSMGIEVGKVVDAEFQVKYYKDPIYVSMINGKEIH